MDDLCCAICHLASYCTHTVPGRSCSAQPPGQRQRTAPASSGLASKWPPGDQHQSSSDELVPPAPKPPLFKYFYNCVVVLTSPKGRKVILKTRKSPIKGLFLTHIKLSGYFQTRKRALFLFSFVHRGFNEGGCSWWKTMSPELLLIIYLNHQGLQGLFGAFLRILIRFPQLHR